ncbi:TPA: hypothetical protein NKR24_002438 [Vibrio parahaemolyticus]|nr:hypothetical protein [Vibrio parahaemolyticus]HCH1694845.1 hypothetical protein [Vibrio parahaemolyticus]
MKKITRKEAKEQGVKLYFTGKACTRGHVAERYVTTARCLECARSNYSDKKESWFSTDEGKKQKSKHAKAYRESPKGRVFRLVDNARRRAKRKGLECNITVEDISIPKSCPLLGVDFEFGDDGHLNLHSPSLDRIDNSKGYIKGNVAVISVRANRIKSTLTLQELELLGEALPKYLAQIKA